MMPQGRALLRLKGWEDEAEGLVQADHGECSDDYYQWYADHDLSQGAVYHLCTCEAKKCKVKLKGRDRRHLVHVDKWRLMSPAII